MKKYLHDQVDNNNMTTNEKKGINQPLLFDTVRSHNNDIPCYIIF